MSRAFVKDDGEHAPEIRYDLPDPSSPHFDEAAAWALLQGADQGDSPSAERATGYRWGERRLVPHVERILAGAESRNETRLTQLARRFLRASQSP
jgi:hypothetical protein